MALSHFKNSHAAVNKWEVVNPALFEVEIVTPSIDASENRYSELIGKPDDGRKFKTDALNGKTKQLLLEHVRSISGLDGVNPALGTVIQKFKQAERVYLGVPEQTHLELTITFSLNLNNLNENYIYNELCRWYMESFNPATGSYGLKKDYTGEMTIYEYNRDGSVWRQIACHNVVPGQPTGMNDRNYDSGNEANEISMTFYVDYWDAQTVGLPHYEPQGI